MRRDPANPLDTATAAGLRQQGLDPYAPDTDGVLPRSRGERMHDAFENLCRTFLENGLGGVHHKVPTGINVTSPTTASPHNPVRCQPSATAANPSPAACCDAGGATAASPHSSSPKAAPPYAPSTSDGP